MQDVYGNETQAEWDDLYERFCDLMDEGKKEGSPEMKTWQDDYMELRCRSPHTDPRFLPSGNSDQATAGEYFGRAAATLGAMIGGAWLGGKKR